jgi:hypothetical protein
VQYEKEMQCDWIDTEIRETCHGNKNTTSIIKKKQTKSIQEETHPTICMSHPFLFQN